MESHRNQTAIVIGGTGNVGGFLVRALLDQGTTVAVPSRSGDKIRDLISYLEKHTEPADLDRLHTFTGNAGDEDGAESLAREIMDALGPPDAVMTSLGSWQSAPSLLKTPVSALQHVLDHYLTAHFVAARAFIPALKHREGTYIFINGPLAFAPWKGSAAGLVSIATAGQHMLFQALAQELEDDPVRVAELVTHAFIRERQTQPQSPLPGEAVGLFAAHIASERTARFHGKSLQLRSLEQLEAAGLELGTS